MNTTPHAMQAGWHDAELEAVSTCPACGALEREHLYAQLRDTLFATGTRGWEIWQCSHCGSAYMDPRPDASSIGRAYAHYLTHLDPAATHQKDNGRSLAWQLVNDYLLQRYGFDRTPRRTGGHALVRLLPPLALKLDYFARHLPPCPAGGRLLDLGCGNGAFLLRAQSAGWQAEGIDFDPHAVDLARKAGLAVWHRTPAEHLKQAGNGTGYDVITISHVIEHVHDPAALLRIAFALLKPGGRLWLATPNLQSLGHRWLRETWLAMDVPRHLCLFTPNALLSLAGQSGFVNTRLLRRGPHSRGVFYGSFQHCVSPDFNQALGLRWRAAILLVDLLSCLSPLMAEELLLTARRPPAT